MVLLVKVVAKMTKLSKISIAIFSLSFLVQLAVCNHVAVKTKELNTVNSQISGLQSQISAINQEIYLASSILGMEQKAKDQGFASMQVQVKTIVNPTIARAF